MAIWIIIILGVVQGASEFLPISSSGHLVMFYNIFNITENTILLSLILHVATLLAVVFCYRNDILNLIKKPFCPTNLKLVLATVPTLIIVLILRSAVEKTFTGDFIIIGFLITALVLIVSQISENNRNRVNKQYYLSKADGFVADRYDITNLDISYKQALFIGSAQGFAVFPGISRSGSTIATALIMGVKKQQAADFSFLLSIPIILAGLFSELIEVFRGDVVLNISWLNLSVGFVLSFIVGVASIKLMIKFVKQKKLIWFSGYLFLLAAFLILNRYVFMWF